MYSHRKLEALGIGRNRWTRIRTHIPQDVVEENILYALAHNVLPFYSLTQIARLMYVSHDTVGRLLKRRACKVWSAPVKGLVGAKELMEVLEEYVRTLEVM